MGVESLETFFKARDQIMRQLDVTLWNKSIFSQSHHFQTHSEDMSKEVYLHKKNAKWVVRWFSM